LPEGTIHHEYNPASGRLVRTDTPNTDTGYGYDGKGQLSTVTPNSVAVGRQFAYVSDASNDSISVINESNQKIVGHFCIRLDPGWTSVAAWCHSGWR
jgi:YD repeat-containing protein